MPLASFGGLRVLALEARRAAEIDKLIRTYGGEPTVVPAMRELPLETQGTCFAFAERLLAGEYDLLVFLTGVGVRTMLEVASTRYDRDALVEAMRRVGEAGGVAARGVKPAGALRELGVRVACVAAEPMTYRELLEAMDRSYPAEQLKGMRAALQEYGKTNPELVEALEERCASVDRVPVYRWDLPEDVEPLRATVRGLIDGAQDVVMFLTGVQATHLFAVAREMGMEEELRRGLARTVVVSVGPSTTEELREQGVTPDFEPSRPKMGFLVNEAAQVAGALLEQKRASAAQAEAAEAAEERPAMEGLMPFDLLHEISSRIASADPWHLVLERIVAFVAAIVPCDSCFVYSRESEKLLLRASKNPHADVVDRLGLLVGEGVTGWVAQHLEPVAIASRASEDPRFSLFNALPEDRFEAMLSVPILCANRVVGVINVQHRESYVHTDLQIRLLSTIGFLVGAEMERARLETENLLLTSRLETRRLVDRAKAVLQRDLHMPEDEAYRTMQGESRRRRKSLREIAEAVLLSDDLRRGSAAAK